MRPVVRNQADVRNIRHRHSIIFGEDIATRSTDVPLTSNSLSAGFMYTKICRSIAVSLAGLFIVYCSSLDQYTGVGEDIIKDTDPSFMDFDKNFFAVALDSSCTDTGYSLPSELASGFGKHPGLCAAGSDSTSQAYTYVHFKANIPFVLEFDTTDEFDSIVFVFDTLSDSLRPSTITDATELTLYETDSQNADNLTPDAISGTTIGTLTHTAEESAQWSVTITGDNTFADSIFAQCMTSLRYYNKLKTELDTTTEGKVQICNDRYPGDFFIALQTSGNSYAWFKNASTKPPALVIHSHNSPNDTTTVYNTDTLWGYPTLVVSEVGSLISEKKPHPLSSWLPGRTAVFKLDLKALWDTMQTTGFDAILSAAVVLKGDLQSTDNNDTVPPFNYLLVSDSESPENIDELDTLFARANRNYGPIINLKAPSDTGELVLPVDYHLQHYTKSKNQYFYLYIRLVSSKVIWNQEVRWSKPRFKAVLTTSK
jgi:hypothetical protein